MTNVYQDEDKGAGALIARIIQENTVTALPTKVTASPASGNTPRNTHPQHKPAASATTIPRRHRK